MRAQVATLDGIGKKHDGKVKLFPKLLVGFEPGLINFGALPLSYSAPPSGPNNPKGEFMQCMR